MLGLTNQAPQKAIGITASGFFLPLLLPKRQRTATCRQSSDTKRQVKAGIVAAINSANLGTSAQLVNTGNIAAHYGMMVTYTNKWHPPSVVWDSTLRKSKASYSMRKFDLETKRLRVISINTLK